MNTSRMRSDSNNTKKQGLAKRAIFGTARQVFRALGYGVIGAVIVLVIVFVRHLDNRPDLKVWHTAELDEEFTADSPVKTFKDYLALEERLFTQLDERVYTEIAPEDRRKINRYYRGSLTDPGQWSTNWNRSFELSVPTPRVGVVLVHGMSDSPYSLRALGQRLHSEGAWVVGLRVPGHGTAPVGLTDVEWEDMAAAVDLAVRHVRDQVEGRPLYIVGYSNGGALAVQYALRSLVDDSLPTVQGLVLLSPEIGISELAALAVWQERLGHILGLEKLAWNSILPEYDSFKYGSFALNAGKQAHELTQEIQAQITRLESTGALDQLPPIIAFQSVVDDTVTAPALVAGLFDRLPPADHELILFDINRFAEIEPLLTANPTAWIETMLHGRALSYELTLMTNKTEKSTQVALLQRAAGQKEPVVCPLDLSWPLSVYSLSHVALPFPPNDPLYGVVEAQDAPEVRLGDIALRGERGVLQVSKESLMRLRWNPFYYYVEQRVLEAVGLSVPVGTECYDE